MRNIQTILMTVALAGTCFAQESMDNIMKLMDDASAQQVVAAPAQTQTAAPAEVAAPAKVVAPKQQASSVVAIGSVETEPAAKSSVTQPLRDAAAAKRHRDLAEAAHDEIITSWNGMVLRDYPLTPAALEKLRLAEADHSVDMRKEFPDVAFPEGSSAVYRPAMKKLYVFNTLENVQRLEGVMAALTDISDSKSGQVEVEARFIEFSEGALEELGFNWNNIQGQTVGGDWSVKDGSDLFSTGLRTESDVFTQPQTLGDGGESASGDWTANRFADQFSAASGAITVSGDIGANINAVIRAMDQSSGVDVLSAPRIVTRNGEKAVIEVGQKHYYPTDFTAGARDGTILHVAYENFTEQLLGVALSVTPKFLDDDLIEMKMEPQITELLGWRNYQIAPANSSYTYYQYRIGQTYLHDPVVARLPIYRRREIQTKVTIKNGSTMSMGGLISEETEHFSDRVPVLGSIPMIGRLFRSEGDRSVKRNFMIFVTVKKVEPSGFINIVRADLNE